MIFAPSKKSVYCHRYRMKYSTPLPQSIGVFPEIKTVFADHPLIDNTTEMERRVFLL